MTGPRELTYLVPVDVLAAVENAVAALETHGPVVTEALRQLDRATTLAWKAVNLVEATDEEWRFVKHAIGIDRGWNAVYRLVSTLDPPGQEPPANVTPDGPQALFRVLEVPWGANALGCWAPPRPGVFACLPITAPG